MGVIENQVTHQKVVLHTQHSFGRDVNNTTCLANSKVSRKHAHVYWNNNGWYLTDLSSNGTKLNKTLLQHLTKPLRLHDNIQFSHHEEDAWKVISLDKPSSYLKPLDDLQECIELGDGVILPNEQSPKWTFFQDNLQHWVIDDGAVEKQLSYDDNIVLNNVSYKLVKNYSLEETNRNIDIIKSATFLFKVSLDAETVSLQIKINDLTLDVGSKVFNHLLLYLLTERQKHHDQNMSEAECGWLYIDEISEVLTKELLTDVNMYYINILIHRLRKALIKLSPYGPLFANIIERAKGKVRVGNLNYEVEKEQ